MPLRAVLRCASGCDVVTRREHLHVAATTWVIAGICVGLAVSGPDVLWVLTAIVALGISGAATYVWLMAVMDEWSRQ